MYTDRAPSFPDPVVLCGLMTAAPFLSPVAHDDWCSHSLSDGLTASVEYGDNTFSFSIWYIRVFHSVSILMVMMIG